MSQITKAQVIIEVKVGQKISLNSGATHETRARERVRRFVRGKYAHSMKKWSYISKEIFRIEIQLKKLQTTIAIADCTEEDERNAVKE